MKLEISNRKKFGKFKTMWKLKNAFLKYQWVKEEIPREIRKYFELS